MGITLVFSGDRSYNTWGGMIDMPHYAFSVARNEELLYNLVSEYAKESVALGYHQVFHGYGNEIGSFYGDDPNYIATMSAIETHAYQDNNFSAHSKHFIAHGGRNSYSAAKSPADLIFENAFRDLDEAFALIASPEYQAEQFELMTNEDINRARRPEITAMEEQLMVESTILLKNDGILPLAADKKIYVESNNSNIKPADIAALSAKATVVDTLDEADVAVIHVTSFDDAYELFVEDATDAGVPIVLVFEGSNSSEPGLTQFLDSNALIMQTYNNTPDHGTSTGSFYRYVSAPVTAQMLFGEKEPSGTTLFELGYDAGAHPLLGRIAG